MLAPIVGIDLGTTNSVIAYVDDVGNAQTIAGRDGHRIVPSVIIWSTSWPMRSERGGRQLAQVKAALGSSVVLVCRPHPVGAEGFYDDVVRALEARIAERLDAFEGIPKLFKGVPSDILVRRRKLRACFLVVHSTVSSTGA